MAFAVQRIVASISSNPTNLFVNLEEAKSELEAFRLDYNTFRPHSSLGYLTPAQAEMAFYEQKEKRAG